MTARALLPILILPLMAACTVRHEVQAVERDGQVVFEDRRGGGYCLTQVRIWRDADDITVWAVDRETYDEPPCANRFPVTYGVTPPGMTETTPPAPLEPGVAYQLRGWDKDFYTGGFRIREDGSIENLSLPPG